MNGQDLFLRVAELLAGGLQLLLGVARLLSGLLDLCLRDARLMFGSNGFLFGGLNLLPCSLKLLLTRARLRLQGFELILHRLAAMLRIERLVLRLANLGLDVEGNVLFREQLVLGTPRFLTCGFQLAERFARLHLQGLKLRLRGLGLVAGEFKLTLHFANLLLRLGKTDEAPFLFALPEAVETDAQHARDQMDLGDCLFGFRQQFGAGGNLAALCAVARVGKKVTGFTPRHIHRAVRRHRMQQGRNKTFRVRRDPGLGTVTGVGFPRDDDRQDAVAAPELFEASDDFVGPRILRRAWRADDDEAAGVFQRQSLRLAEAAGGGSRWCGLINGVNPRRNHFAPGIGLADEFGGNGKRFQRIMQPVRPAEVLGCGGARTLLRIVLWAVAKKRPMLEFGFGHRDTAEIMEKWKRKT